MATTKIYVPVFEMAGERVHIPAASAKTLCGCVESAVNELAGLLGEGSFDSVEFSSELYGSGFATAGGWAVTVCETSVNI